MQRFFRRTFEGLLWLALVASGCTAAYASDASRLYAPCVVCHQPSAWGSSDGEIPGLAGQQRRYIERQMALFQTGARTDTAMEVVAAHPAIGDPRTTVRVATYLSTLDSNPDPVVGPGDHLRLGQEAFTHICAACHGVDGRGSSSAPVPRIGGQHYPYLRRQIESAAELHKDLAPPEMASALRGMSPQEKDAVADYVSRLGNSESLLDANRFDRHER